MRGEDGGVVDHRGLTVGDPDAGIETLGFNVRAINCLRQAGVVQVRDLIRRDDADLLKVPNLGQGTLEHIRGVLGKCGFELGKGSGGSGVDESASGAKRNIGRASIEALGFSVRAVNGLRQRNVMKVEDLVGLSENDLLEVPNLGRSTVEHIVEVLREHGQSLRTELAHEDVAGCDEGKAAKKGESGRGWEEMVRALPLSDRKWSVLKWRFGVGMRLTLQEVADRIGLTRERVRQIQKSALAVLGQQIEQMTAGLRRVEELFGHQEGAAVRGRRVQQFVDRMRTISDGDPTEQDIIRLLIAVRSLGSLGVAEREWPTLSFRACMLSPPIKEHGAVREYLEEVARRARDRTRQWSYRELAVHVLKEAKGPLHWREVAERCEAFGRRRSFSASTCFNQMQADQDVFVRVGQGTYALAEWGLERSESINDLVAEFLFESGRCLTYGELLHRANARQRVKKSSVQMTLDLHPRFYRALSGKYGLRAWLPARDMQTLRTVRDLVETEDSARRVRIAGGKGYNVARMVSADRKRCAVGDPG